jgi:hypothetical protein
MRGKTRNYPNTDFFWTRGHKGPIVSSGSGPFLKEYVQLAIQRENFPFSSFQQSILPTHADMSSGHRTMDGVTYILTMPMSKRDAIREAKKIRGLGGLARVMPAWGGKQMVWFNPNGSPAALEYVAGW